MSRDLTADLVLDARATLGEGAIWDARSARLYWVDIMGKKLHVFDPSTNLNRTIGLDQFVGTVVPRRSGGVMLALHHGFASMDLETGEVNMICDPESHLPNTRFNDGKCDPQGRFWAGTMAMDTAPRTGSLYRLDPDRSVRRMLTDVTISNGIAWSPDHSTMYYVDTPTLEVTAFDYEPETGAIRGKRAAIRIPAEEGYPDGITMDAEGKLWIAHWEGWRVNRWDPKSGRLLQTVRLPVSLVTSCAFGGTALDKLYITTARQTLGEAALASQPHAGGVFCVEPGVVGVSACAFAG